MEVSFKKKPFRRRTEKRSISDENFNTEAIKIQSFKYLARSVNLKDNTKSLIYNNSCQVFKNEVGVTHVEIFVYKKGKLVMYPEENDKIEINVSIDQDLQSYCVITKEKIVAEHPNTNVLLMKFMNDSDTFSPFHKKDLHVNNFASIPIYVTVT